MESLGPFGDRHGPSGHWSGHYHHDTPSQAGRTFPIHATLWESGGRIEGVMSDEVTDFAYSLRKVLDSAQTMGVAPSPAISEMLRRHPGAIIETTLPTDSVVRGRFSGDVVAFAKTYEGPHSIRYRDALTNLGSIVRPKHQVHYSGVLDAARGVIEGTWEIRQPGLFGRFRARQGTGTFFLARAEG